MEYWGYIVVLAETAIFFILILFASFVFKISGIEWFKLIHDGYVQERISTISFGVAVAVPLLSVLDVFPTTDIILRFQPSSSYPQGTYVLSASILYVVAFFVLRSSGRRRIELDESHNVLKRYIEFARNQVNKDFCTFVDRYTADLNTIADDAIWRVTFFYSDSELRSRFFAIARRSNKEAYERLRKYDYRAPKESCIAETWSGNTGQICEQRFDGKKEKSLDAWIKNRGYESDDLNMKSQQLVGLRIKSQSNGKEPKSGHYKGVIIFEIENRVIGSLPNIVKELSGTEEAKALRRALWDMAPG